MEEYVQLRDALIKQMANAPLANTEVLGILEKIKEKKMTLEILQATKIGAQVNMVRKKDGASTEVQVLAKTLAKAYKMMLDSSKSSGASATTPRRPSATKVIIKMPVTKCGDGKRDVIRAQLCNVGLCADGVEEPNAPRVAVALENAINQKSKNAAEYMASATSRIKNLKDNSELRRLILDGEVTAMDVARMTSKEMMSAATKAQAEEIDKAMLLDKQMAFVDGARTTDFPCPRCKKRDVSYTQAQTRSADEPMTTFCACLQCGKRWKFC
eukprot:m.155370 g.155370  ORF g.155370 m.155370 type:complete len:270 (+) comp30934_c1_seq1:126-935(+)